MPRKKKPKSVPPWTRFLNFVAEIPWWRGRPYVVATAWTVGVAGLIFAWVRGVPELHASVAASSWRDDLTIEFPDRPAWVRGDLLSLLEETALRQITGNPLSRPDLVHAHEALLNTGWFDAIQQVRRVRADLVRVDATFVTPAAVVRDDEGDHLVTCEGLLLPRSYEHGGAAEMIVITGVRLPRPHRPGAQWDGMDVYSALSLAQHLDDRAWRNQVASIDVEAYDERGQLVIVTDVGARIVWGSPPGEEQTLEVSAERKLAYLDRAYEDFGRIDTGYAGTLRFYDRGYFAE